MTEGPSGEQGEEDMSNSYAQERTYRRPQQARYIRRHELDELFDYEDIAVKLQVAQSRIVEAFVYATERRRGKTRGTDGYIVGVDKRQKDLVDYIMTYVIDGRRHGIVICSELPEWLGNSKSKLHAIADDANRRLVAIRLSELCQQKHIWFNEYHGIWEIEQSMMDLYHKRINDAREIRKVDERLRREALHSGGRLILVH